MRKPGRNGTSGNKNEKSLARFKPKTVSEKKNNPDVWSKIARHRTDIAVRVILIAVIVIAAAGFFYVKYLNREYSSYKVISQANISVSVGAKVRRFGNNILIYTNDGIRCLNGKGGAIWDETFQMQNPSIDINGDVVGIADYNGSTIHMMDSNGSLGTINTGKPIRKFNVSDKGLALAILDDTPTTPIYIYDSEGNQKAYFSTSMHDSGYPLDICITENGYLVGISYLQVFNGSFKTNVAFYNFGEVGQNETDNLVSMYSYSGAVVPKLRFIGNNKAMAVADNRLMFYSGDQKPTSSGEVLVQDEIQSVYYGGEYAALVFRNTEKDADRYRIEIYDGSGRKKDEISFDDEFSEIFFDGKRVIVYNAEKCLIHNVGGIDKYSGEFDSAVLTVLPTNVSNRFVLVTNDSIQTIELE